MARLREVNESTFETEVLSAKTPVVVDFWATWCGPCNTLSKVVEEIANDYDGQVKVAKVDVSSNQVLAGRYGVQSVPTLLFFKGGRVTGQLVGTVPKTRIAEKLEMIL